MVYLYNFLKTTFTCLILNISFSWRYFYPTLVECVVRLSLFFDAAKHIRILNCINKHYTMIKLKLFFFKSFRNAFTWFIYLISNLCIHWCECGDLFFPGGLFFPFTLDDRDQTQVLRFWVKCFLIVLSIYFSIPIL